MKPMLQCCVTDMRFFLHLHVKCTGQCLLRDFGEDVWDTTGRKRSASGNLYIDSDEVHHEYDPNDYEGKEIRIIVCK